MRFKILLVLFILLFSTTVFAEEFKLSLDEQVEFKTLSLKPTTLGSSNSIVLEINNIKVRLTKGEPKDVFGVSILLKEINKLTKSVVLEISQTAECLIDSDCEAKYEKNKCYIGFCDLSKCRFRKTEGCMLDNSCKPFGSFAEYEDILSYCGEDSIWHERVEEGAYCDNNFECLSNFCSGNKCFSLDFHKKPNKSILLFIMGLILILLPLLFIKLPQHKKLIFLRRIKIPENLMLVLIFLPILIGVLLIILGFI